MELVCIEGAVPGRVVATLAHEARIRQIAMEIANHPAGGWHVALPDGTFGPRCRSVTAAILLEASETYVDAGGLRPPLTWSSAPANPAP